MNSKIFSRVKKFRRGGGVTSYPQKIVLNEFHVPENHHKKWVTIYLTLYTSNYKTSGNVSKS